MNINTKEGFLILFFINCFIYIVQRKSILNLFINKYNKNKYSEYNLLTKKSFIKK